MGLVILHKVIIHFIVTILRQIRKSVKISQSYLVITKFPSLVFLRHGIYRVAQKGGTFLYAL